ncbi:DUF721 domain-containing protein [Sulfitobacter geojensis]|uniref:DUF721 domain-containing protein n=1 Tax=Sulfitobacter geojensis TaxID=1342299 RepID=UPI0036DEB96D
MPPRRTSTKGFKRTDSLLSGQIRRASETRGFAQSRLLTQWNEIAGQDIAAIARPVEIGYSRGGMGATLTLLTNGANAPMLEMQKEQLRAKVNAVYGYNAIARVRVTQTAATGFADGKSRIQTTRNRRRNLRLIRPCVNWQQRRHNRFRMMGCAMPFARLGENILNKTNR